MKKLQTFVAFNFLYIFLIYCGLFLIIGVLSDAPEADEPTLDIQPTLLLSQNVSDNAEVNDVNIKPSEGNQVPSDEAHDAEKAINSAPTDGLDQFLENVVSEVVSDHAGVINEIINNDTPIVISRIDSATEELQKRANIPSPLSNQIDEYLDTTEANATDPSLTEVGEDRSDINATTLETEEKMPKNLTTETNAEDIPSFSEWAQKHLEEAEKKEQVNSSSPNQTANATKQGSGAKLRWKNYASVDCGAKVILANPEAQHTWAVLVGSRDEYILNPCNSRIWLIVELCEAIQLKRIDLANYELFSSSPKDFTVSVSDRFPTRDWSIVGQFTAKDQRDVQTFDVNTETFGKYVKVEIKSHYGSEHYCPLSLFRAYGMSVFEVLQKDDPGHEQPIDDDDDDDDDDTLNHSFKEDSSGNLLNAATDAVLSMVKKAAQVLGNKVNKTNESSQISNDAKPSSPLIKSCSSPSHYVVCNNCSDMLFGKIFELLSCSQKQVMNLVAIPFITKALINSRVCHKFGFNFRENNTNSNADFGCVDSFFPPHFLGAMCNTLAVTHNKVSYNISHQYANTTDNIPNDNLVNVDTNSKPKIIPVVDMDQSEDTSEEETGRHQPTEPLDLERPDVNSKSSCSTDTTYTSQIKPSKSLVTELPVSSELNTSNIGENGQPVADIEEQRGSDEASIEPTIVFNGNDVTSEVELQTEGNLEENVDKLITELNTEASPSVVNTAAAASNLQGQKESVFLRLSNRIKALERNMSLSSQYLEELSKRYKKQVEEMQRVLEKTEQTLNQVRTKEEDRHKQLEERLESLTKAMETILAERNSWKVTSYWLFFAVAGIFLVYGIKRYSGPKPPEGAAAKPAEIHRRNSIDVVTRVATKKKKRRPSDQALKIVTSAASGDQPKKRKKKSSNPSDSYSNYESGFSPPCTSSKIWRATSNPGDWVEGRSRFIEDIPFALEESDSSTLEGLPLASELIANNAPGYAKTAATLRLGRSSLRNGRVNKPSEELKRKSSPVSSINGSVSSATEHTPKKERRGFKKLFKKVF